MNCHLRKKLLSFSMPMLGLLGAVHSHAQTTATGPSTLQTPYVKPVLPGFKTISLLSVNDSVCGYPMAGIPDGLGAFDNGNGTFTLLMNHELGGTSGRVRDHGTKGSFVSKWIINKSNLSVVKGSDLMQTVKLWNGTGFDTYNGSNPAPIPFSRFCSADLPEESAFYNSATMLGTKERIFMNGEETGAEGRAVGHIVSGPNAGTSYELPYLGKFSWENSVASPKSSDRTIVAGLDDAGGGQVYFYIGTKTNTGNEIEKAGLNNGKLFGVKVTGVATEARDPFNISAGTAFSLYDLGNVANMTGAQLQTASTTNLVTEFLRPEDGAWDPKHPNDFYFATTDRYDQVKDGAGSQVGRSRLYRVRFTDINNPEMGGTISAVLDGTEAGNMIDNIGIDKYGHILLQEDVGGQAHNGKILQYDIATDALKIIAKHDPARFGDIGMAATAPYNNDEESSGIIDMQDILGAGWNLLVVQAHYSAGIHPDLVQGGQLLALYNPDTYQSSRTSSGLQTPYLVPFSPATPVSFTSILSVNDSINGYPMVGIPDGLGAFDNGNGTFTLLMNHELGGTSGRVRDHGTKGSFVSKWVINKSNLSVVSGSDLMQTVKLWNGTGFDTYNGSNPAPIPFSRFCSADLPEMSAFYNSATMKGTMERIFMNGEETGAEGRAVGHIVSGPNAGTSYELPYLGKFSWENSVASPNANDKTIVAGLDDAGGGQVYFYIGTKTNTGNEIEKAGLSNGKLFGLKVNGVAIEAREPFNIPAGTAFSLYDLGNVANTTGAALETSSSANGVTAFMRPEDGVWDPNNPNDFYFATTDRYDQVKDGMGSQVGRSRLYRARFADINNPEMGGTITAVLDGTEAANMMDNIGMDKYGHIFIQEDVGNQQHNGKILQYDIATDALKIIGKHDPARFGDIGMPATAPFNQDEESSGIIDMEDILGAGKHLVVIQAHYSAGIHPDLVQGGQLLLMEVCPEAPAEICGNGIDDNCDGVVDEGCPYTWYRDFDGDGFGNPARSIMATTKPAGYVADNTDCNDGDATRNPAAPELEDGKDNDCDGQVDEGLACQTIWYLDADGDGIGRNSTTRMSCVKPANYVAVGGDCNDQDATINPNATELPDGKDNDCNGQIDDGLACLTTWYIDRDGDGHGSSSLTKMSCIRPTDYVANNTDCNDQNASIYLGALELCDGKDNDCDGMVDENCQVGSLWYFDFDKDGYGNPDRAIVSVTQPDKYVSNNQDCNDGDPTRYPGATEMADGIDNDCDGQVDEGLGCRMIWYVDRDGDGFGSPSLSKFTCVQPAGYVANADDCNDQRSTVYPGAPEICDGFDNDCNGVKDDNCAPLVTGIEKLSAKPLVKADVNTPEITVYPNPARDEIVVTINGFEAGKKVEMRMIQVDGKAVMAKNLVPAVQNEQVRLDVRGMSSGFYLLQVKQGINQQTKKVMIVR